MSSNMAAGDKAVKVLTSYKQYELKLVKVAIRRHHITITSNNVQPLQRDVDEPFSITALVHNSGIEHYGKLLFRKVIPNTVQLPPEAYAQCKSNPGKQKAAPPPAPEPGPSRQRSASCSSEEELKQERRSNSHEDYTPIEVAPVAKQKRRSPERERSRSRVPSSGRAHETSEGSARFEKRKSTRSTSRSPSPKHSRSRRRHSPSNSPHDRCRSRSPRRSKSPPPVAKESVRNLSTRRGIFVPDKWERSSRNRDRHSCSKSPSPSSHRRRSRRRSRDDSRERHRRSSRSPSRERDRHRSTTSRDRDRHRSTSRERRSDERRAELSDQAGYFARGGYYDPSLIRAAPPVHFYPPMQPFFPTPPLGAPFFNRPFYAPPDHAFAEYRPRKKLPVYNNRKIPKYTGPVQAGMPNAVTAQACNGQLQENPAANGIVEQEPR